MTYRIDLDTVTDTGFFNDSMIQFMAKKNIKFELIEWNGPGGGNPVIRYTGKLEDLETLCHDWYDDEKLVVHATPV